LSADIRFVEVDVAPLLSKATLQKMRVKLEERARLRRQRARREAQQVWWRPAGFALSAA